MKIKFVKQESHKSFSNPLTGRSNSYRYVAVNELGQKGCLPNEDAPYMPIGGIAALKLVKDILIFKNDKPAKEKKRKSEKVTNCWGTKNSQVRLDKAARRYGKRSQSGNCARYY